MPNTGLDLLNRQLRRDAGAREASVVGFMRWITPVTALMALSLWPMLGRGHTLWLVGTLSVVSIYYWFQTLLLSRGFRPWMQFSNVALEVSAPSALYLLDLHYQGPAYALTAPPIFIWATLILLSALRSNQRLAIFAGSLAALEYLVLYFAFTLPRMGAESLVTLTPPFILIRVFLLFAAGVATSILAGHLIRLSQQALRTIREEDVMGKYQLEAPIGKGGMAEVFRALYCPEGGFRKQVALKRIHESLTGNQQFVDMFRRETYLGSLLNHPNIVQVHDAGRHHGRYFLAMEYVDGLSLATALSRLDRPLPLAALTYLGAELAEGLFYIHTRGDDDDGHPLGLVHRDVNPPNILISRRGDVKLADFGIARTNEMDAMTSAGDIRGKMRFMAPEQILGEPLDARTDLYALGLTLYLALTGRGPFPGANLEAIREAILTREAPAPSKVRSDVPTELDVALTGVLRRQVAHRTASGKELHDRLCLIRGVAAPYPHGKAELAAYIQEALARMTGVAPPENPWKIAAPSPMMVDAPEVTEGADPGERLEQSTVAGRKRN